MKYSKIEWCDHTFNPWEGCTKVSPGCANCYAEARNIRWSGGVNWGPFAPRRRTSEANWRQPLKWNREAGLRAEAITRVPPIARKFKNWHRPRVFCASLADVFDPKVPHAWRRDLFFLITQCHHLDFLLLTKRPELVIDQLKAISSGLDETWNLWEDWEAAGGLPNVWIGTTVEDQKRADERIPELLKIPARVRFLSCEPLLGPVNLCEAGAIWSDINNNPIDGRGLNQHVHWVICGGESGPKARPMHPDWARSLRDQCQAAGVPFLFKQWGEAREVRLGEATHWLWSSGLMQPIFAANASSAQREGAVSVARVGKAAAGRLLDGREWSQFPEGQP